MVGRGSNGFRSSGFNSYYVAHVNYNACGRAPAHSADNTRISLPLPFAEVNTDLPVIDAPTVTAVMRTDGYKMVVSAVLTSQPSATCEICLTRLIRLIRLVRLVRLTRLIHLIRLIRPLLSRTVVGMYGAPAPTNTPPMLLNTGEPRLAQK